jgi:hypothetical protein
MPHFDGLENGQGLFYAEVWFLFHIAFSARVLIVASYGAIGKRGTFQFQSMGYFLVRNKIELCRRI